MPDQIISTNNLIDAIYGPRFQEMSNPQLAERVILATTNKETLEMNEEIISRMPGESRVFFSADSIVTEDPSDISNYPPEFLHAETPSGMPPHKLALKIGVIVMLLRNLNPKKGLCNGTRLIVKSHHNNFIMAEIVSECNRGETVIIPRIDLAPSDINLPFIIKRRQLPIIPAYAMTINKSQGQTFAYVGINLTDTVFAHGQLYVALSRCKNRENLKVRIVNNDLQGNLLKNNRIFTQNIVYVEVFDE